VGGKDNFFYPDLVPVFIFDIASIFYRRLEGEKRGWPKRKQYTGEFWSGKLYHYENVSATDKGEQIWKCIDQVSKLSG